MQNALVLPGQAIPGLGGLVSPPPRVAVAPTYPPQFSKPPLHPAGFQARWHVVRGTIAPGPHWQGWTPSTMALRFAFAVSRSSATAHDGKVVALHICLSLWKYCYRKKIVYTAKDEDGGDWWHEAVIINCVFLMATTLGSIPANSHFQVERACSPNALHIPVLGIE